MIYADEKRKLFEGVVNHNIQERNFIGYAQANVAVPEPLLKRWKERFYTLNPIDKYPVEPRLINHYSVGADPEFGFISPTGEYTHAGNLGLTTLSAFGCDLSGRQAELRAAPSKFVLEVVASMADALRWLSLARPVTRKYKWLSNGYIGGDGCGGHIHFGRKQPGIKGVIKSLDWLTWKLNQAGVLNGAEQRRIGTRYGREKDYRAQPYGYEYRGISTWLCNPFIAHLILTLAKLSILHDLTKAGDNITKMDIFALLSAYQNVDDDARIALQALLLRKRVAIGSDDDMKKHWGIYTGTNSNSNAFYPPIIPASNMTKHELFLYLTKGTPMKETIPAVTWNPNALQKDEFVMDIQPHTAGLSEIAQGLISKFAPVSIMSSGSGQTIVHLPKQLLGTANAIRAEIKKLGFPLPNVLPNNGREENRVSLHVSRAISNNFIVDLEVAEKYKKFLTSGVLPIVKYEDYERLHTLTLPKVVETSRVIGRVL